MLINLCTPQIKVIIVWIATGMKNDPKKNKIKLWIAMGTKNDPKKINKTR